MNTNPPPPLLPEVAVFALVPDYWGPEWQSRHHILTRLARYFHVVWMNKPPRWRALFSKRYRDPGFQCGTEIEAPFPVYDAGYWLPMVGRPVWLDRLCSRQRLRGARRRLKRPCTKTVLYLWRPEFDSALLCMPHDLSCYQVDDEYCFFRKEDELDPRELRLMQSVGQVFIQSPALMEKKGWVNPHTEFIPNGADYEQYACPIAEPEDLRRIPYPRIGYAGVVKNQLDWRLLLELTARHRDWSFVFVGALNPHPEMDALLPVISSRPNVYFLGAKDARQISHYPQHFDVCIMPYRVDGYTKYIYPLKLHELLASGRPCVATPIATLQGFQDVLLLAASTEQWCEAIKRALGREENTPARRAARQQVAQAHDWDLLVERIASSLATRLGLELPGRTQPAGATSARSTGALPDCLAT